jgi:hypothetical protein
MTSQAALRANPAPCLTCGRRAFGEDGWGPACHLHDRSRTSQDFALSTAWRNATRDRRRLWMRALERIGTRFTVPS